MIQGLMFLFLQKLQGAEKPEELVKNDPPPGFRQRFRSRWKMNLPESGIFFRQSVILPDIFRKKFFRPVHIKSGSLRFSQSLIGQSCGQGIYRLERLHHLPVFFPGTVLRMFQHHPAVFINRRSCKNISLSLFQSSVQIRHIKPPQKNLSAFIGGQAGTDLQPSRRLQMDRRSDLAKNRTPHSGFYLTDRNRLRVGHITSRIMMHQILHRLNMKPFQKFFCLFSDSFYVSY